MRPALFLCLPALFGFPRMSVLGFSLNKVIKKDGRVAAPALLFLGLVPCLAYALSCTTTSPTVVCGWFGTKEPKSCCCIHCAALLLDSSAPD